MTATRHTIAACRSGSYNGMDWEAEFTITFDYVPGAAPIIHPADNACPGWAAEISYVSHTPQADYPPAFENEIEWCKDWLYENADECIEVAERDNEPDPDYLNDLRREDEYLERQFGTVEDDWT